MNASRKRILVHHVMVILVYGTGLVKGSMHFWGAIAGLCESSNIFLANVELVKCCSDVQKLKQSFLYKLNSAFLTLAYICCRLVLFPAARIKTWKAFRNFHGVVDLLPIVSSNGTGFSCGSEAVLAALLTDAYTNPELTVRSSVLEWVLMPLAICCVWGMSAFEFRNIFEGMFKAPSSRGFVDLGSVTRTSK